MVRKQVYITAEQDAKLKRLAAERGVTEAEVIRGAIDETETVSYEQAVSRAASYIREVALEERPMSSREDLKWSRGDSQAGWASGLDDDAWREELAFIERLARTSAQGAEAVRWRREDAYDKRRLRLPD